MAVLCEGISVIIRADRALDRFNSFEAFQRIVPNSTLSIDGELIRIGFMSPEDVKIFIDQLQSEGLSFLQDGHAIDIVVVDQLRGPTAPCDWLEFGNVSLGDGSVSAARFKNTSVMQLFTPEGWVYEGSLSQTYGFVPSELLNKSLSFLRRENGLDVYFNSLTGKEVYIGRTSSEDNEQTIGGSKGP